MHGTFSQIENRPEQYGPHFVPKQFGPVYPNLGNAVAKFRRMSKGGLSDLSLDDRKAYGTAVEAAILQLQRTECGRALPSIPKPNCASGTYHNTAESIEKAVREQNRRRATAPGPARTPAQWESAYAHAMEETRANRAKSATAGIGVPAVTSTESATTAAQNREDKSDKREPNTVATDNSTDPDREAALELLRQGLASPAEVARAAGVSRQLVGYWMKDVRFDWQEAREKAVKRSFREARR